MTETSLFAGRDSNPDIDHNEALTEITCFRTESTKIFSMGGNRACAVSYAFPVHRYDEAEKQWQEINASFLEEKGCLTSETVDMAVTCAVSGEQPFITLQDRQGHQLKWGYVGVNAVIPEAVREEHKEINAFERVLYGLRATARYPEVFPEADMVCRVDRHFKDEIVFRANARPVICTLEAEGYELKQNRDQSIDVLLDSRVCFTILSPVLQDTKGQIGRVEARLEESRTGWLIHYIPDEAFLAGAAYPVTLDPEVIVSGSTSGAIADTWIGSSASANNSSDTYLRVGYVPTSFGTRRTLLKVNTLPGITEHDYMTNAYLCMPMMENASNTTDGVAVYLYELTGSWTPSAVTWANAPAARDFATDYVIAKYMSTVRFDITEPARRWYQGETNNGVMLRLEEGDYYQAVTFCSSEYSLAPYMLVEYASLGGLESYLTYDGQSAGRAGTGYVSLVNGNLIWAHQDTMMNGERMPVSVTHYYNSCYASDNSFYMGYGWRTSLHQTLQKALLNGTNYYIYGDGDGTEHFFKQVSGKWTDESGLALTLTVNSGSVTITDKGNNVMTFPTVSGTPSASSPYTAKVLVNSIADPHGNTATITHSGLKITKVTDGAGRETNFVYTSNLCTAIYPPWLTADTGIRFTYTGSCPTTITYENSKTSTLTYDSNHLLLTAVGPQNVQATYTYYNAATAGRNVRMVSSAVVTGGTLTGSSVTYTYGSHVTVVTDGLTGKKLRYHFNDNGNQTSVDDELGYAVYTKYDTSDGVTPVNHPTMRSRMMQAVNNYLKDSLFQDSTFGWTTTGTATANAYDTSRYCIGTRSRKITIAANGTAGISQTVSVSANKPYTFSAYVNTGAPDAFLRVQYTKSGVTTTIDSDKAAVTTDSTFTRQSVSFTLPSGVSSVTCQLMVTGAAGSAWFDCPQLEDGLTVNHFNLLQNGNFKRGTVGENMPTGWTIDKVNELNWQHSYALLSTPTVTPPAALKGRALQARGRFDRAVRFMQTLNVSGHAGDMYTAGGWCCAFAKKLNAASYIDCQIRVLFSGYDAGEASWNDEEGTWQFACGTFVAPHDYSQITVVIQYRRQMNVGEFMNMFLYKEQFGTSTVYDAKGNATSAMTLWGASQAAQYDTYNNLTSYTAPGRTTATTYNYGSTAAQQQKHLLLYSLSPLQTKTEYTYNAHGSVTGTKVSDGTSTSVPSIQTSVTWQGTALNYPAAQTDSRGKVTTTVTDENKGTVTRVTDANGQKVTFSYDTLRRRTKASTTVDGAAHITQNAYNATTGYLSSVKHNTTSATADVTYAFTYDALGRQKTVKVGTVTLVTNAYRTTAGHVNYGTLTSSTFANGHKVVYTYDGWNRPLTVKHTGGAADATYTLAYNANGQAACTQDSALGRTEQMEYDLSNRPCRRKLREGTTHLYTGEVTYEPVTGLLSTFSERVGAGYTGYSTTFGYDIENRATSLVYKSGSTEKGRSTSAYDRLGRLTAGTTKLSSTTFSTAFTYLPGADSTKTTPLVQTLTTTKGTTTIATHTYTYDNVGNILSVNDGSKTTTYVYDAIGQLIRCNDPYDTTKGSAGTTWLYTYDCGGNILSKAAYSYTTGTVSGTPTTITYTYDTTWKDQMSAYNGAALTYDAMGNPLTDGTWTYTWQKGRQLASMTNGSTTVSFAYNADGLRVRKTVGSTVTNYTLHGKNIVHLTRGTDDLHFFYDAQNKPAIVNFNGTAYVYLYNLQGDVVALVNTSGTEVVEYTYDAWGTPLTKTGTLASTLGTVQPFRYRGYVYDEETQLYYLRSRYYRPAWGRFINADSVINGNLYCYCNNPAMGIDPDGHDTTFFIQEAYYEPVLKPVLSDDRVFGTHKATDLMPLHFLLNAAFQMTGDPALGGDAWVYDNPMDYGFVDCNSLFRFICQQFYECSAYNTFLRKKDTVKKVAKAMALDGLHVINSKDELKPGYILVNKDKNHMALFFGIGKGHSHTAVESSAREGKVSFNLDWAIGTGERDFYFYYIPKNVDFSSSGMDYIYQPDLYFTLEDD